MNMTSEYLLNQLTVTNIIVDEMGTGDLMAIALKFAPNLILSRRNSCRKAA
jgi:hypothetical protein